MSRVVPGPEKDIKPVTYRKQPRVVGKPSRRINITVWRNVDKTEVAFRIKRSSQLSKLIKAYCKMEEVDVKTYRFLYDGQRLDQKQTPDDLEMEDGDQIDAMLWMDGGNGKN